MVSIRNTHLNIDTGVDIAVGKVNYILKELYKKGIVGTERFSSLQI